MARLIRLVNVTSPAFPQLGEPCMYLLVVVQVAAALTREKVNSVEDAQRPPGDVVPVKPVIDHPSLGPVVDLVPGQPTLDKRKEALFHVIKSRLASMS